MHPQALRAKRETISLYVLKSALPALDLQSLSPLLHKTVCSTDSQPATRHTNKMHFFSEHALEQPLAAIVISLWTQVIAHACLLIR